MAGNQHYYEVFAGKNGKFYFRLKAPSGEIILASQGYSLRSSARRAIQSVRNHASDGACYQPKTAKNGKWYFVEQNDQNHLNITFLPYLIYYELH